jgi:hypothetical protein
MRGSKKRFFLPGDRVILFRSWSGQLRYGDVLAVQGPRVRVRWDDGAIDWRHAWQSYPDGRSEYLRRLAFQAEYPRRRRQPRNPVTLGDKGERSVRPPGEDESRGIPGANSDVPDLPGAL